jgi:hypothetical protein
VTAETPPPRLFVVMARDAHVAVVIRRGPSGWAQITLWDTDRDVFAEGSWFRGRIFAEKCDLSPDGELFVYAAYKGNRLRTSYTDSWTAVSRPPWLHALALWPFGTTYGGGGRFVDNRRLILRGIMPAHPQHPARGLEVVVGAAEAHRSTGEVEGAGWAGRDHANRLVYAMNGALFARTGGRETMLADFTSQKPRTDPPPEQAKRPITMGEPPNPRRRRR